MARAFLIARLGKPTMLPATLLMLCLGLLPMTGCRDSRTGGGVLGTPVTGEVSLPGQGLTPAARVAGARPAQTLIRGATVEALDADGEVVDSATTDAAGRYTLHLGDGTYRIGVRLGSISYFMPLTSVVIVRGEEVDGTETVEGEATLDLEVPPPLASIAGAVTANGSGVADVRVLFVDPESEAVRYRATTDGSGAFSVAVLPAGNFTVRVDSDTVPSGYAAPTAQNLAVTASGAAPTTLRFELQVATAVPGTIETTGDQSLVIPNVRPLGAPPAVPDPVRTALEVPAGAEVIVIEAGLGEVARAPIASDGSYALNLRDGSYRLEFRGFGSDVVAPPPLRITVKGGLVYVEGQDDAIDPSQDGSLNVLAQNVAIAVAGTATLGGTAVRTRIVAEDAASGAVVASADTDEEGGYSIALAYGSYDIATDGDLLPPGVIRPDPVRVAVETGDGGEVVVREDAGTADDGVVDFVLTPASVNLPGVVRDPSGYGVKDVRVVAAKGEDQVARAVTDSRGAYTLKLPPGTITIALRPESLPTGLLPPEAVRVEVSASGGSTTIAAASGEIGTLDFALEARAPNVTGTVTFDFEGDGTVAAADVVGCRVVVASAQDEDEILLDTASRPADGTYSLTLKNGTYVIGLDPASLPPGSSPPPPERVSVTSGGVTTSDGRSGATAAVDFTLIRRASTLTGVVTIDARVTSVGLELFDLGRGQVVNGARSDSVTGAYRMPVFPGKYELRLDPDTLPPGVAIPTPVPLSVAADGTIRASAGEVEAVNFLLSRQVAALSGTVSVTRGGEVFHVEVDIEVRDPQNHRVLQVTRTDPARGTYALRLLPGSWEIAVDPGSIPPGVLPPPPQAVSVSGTTVSGDAVSDNTLDFTIRDVRRAGAEVTGRVYDATTGDGLRAELRLYDPGTGSAEENFIISVPTDGGGNYVFKATEGTYKLSVLAQSLPPTAARPAGVSLAIRAGAENPVIEDNTNAFEGMTANGENDGVINFAVRDGATSGISITGVVSESETIVLGGVNVRVRDSSTQDIVAQAFTDFEQGRYTMRFPLGSYVLEIHPDSLPFHLTAPAPRSILAMLEGGRIVVTTDDGEAVARTGGQYVFDIRAESASQQITGIVTAPSGDPARVFVGVVESRDERFVMGVWTDVADGTYRLQLSPGSYEVGLDPHSLPFGVIAPAPVAVSVTESGIFEESGTDNDGTVDFALVQANQRISGTVADDAENPIGCFIRIHEATTGRFVRGVPSDPVTGEYAVIIPPGTYKIFIDPPSLPPGFLPPSKERVQVTAGEDAVVDFQVNAAALCITGNVLTRTEGVPLPAFVTLEDASTGEFIHGVPTAPDDGMFRLCAAQGSYKLSIDPMSLPRGMVVPDPVRVQIAATGVLEENTEGEGNADNDGTVNFRIVDASSLAGSLARLAGTVTLLEGGNSIPMGVFVFVEDAADGRFLTGRPTDPADGSYSIYVPEGTYDVLVDAKTLPPGIPAPKPMRIRAVGTTITQLIEGVPVESSELGIVLRRGGSTLSGSVTYGGSGVPCFIIAVDPASGRIVRGLPTDGSGNWRLQLGDGSYDIAVDPPSLPPSFLPPPAVSVTVSSGFVAESAGTENDGVIPFALTPSQSTLQIAVQDAQANGLVAHIVVVNAGDRRTAADGPTSPGREFAVSLSDGVYDVLVDPPSLPFDVVPPIPSRIVVSGENVVLSQAGSGSLSEGRLLITARRRVQAAEVTVRVQDSEGTPLSAVVRAKDGAENVLFTLGVPAEASGGVLHLGAGEFFLDIDPGSVPPGFSLPSEAVVRVEGTTATPSSLTLILTDEQAVLTGTVRNALSEGAALVRLDLYNGEGARVRQGIPLTPVEGTDDATYELTLAEGTYELVTRRAPGVTSLQVILPENVPVAVSDGVVQNPDADPDTEGVQVDIPIPVVVAAVSGTLSLAGDVIPGVTIVARDPVDNRIVNDATTDGQGGYVLALPAGMFKVEPDPLSLDQVAPQAVSAQPYEVQVSGAGDVSVVDRDDLCVEPGPGESCDGLEFALEAFNASEDVLVAGTVRSRRGTDADPTAVAGARVLLIDPVKEAPRSSTLTGADGGYSLIAPEGVWFVVVDPGGLGIGYPTIPAAPVRVAVSGMNITEEDTTGDGNEEDDGVVNFVLVGASAFVQGKVQTSAGVGVGCRLVVSTADRTETPEDFAYTIFTDPGGNFFLPVGEGSFKLWVAPESLPPGFLPPSPTVFVVSGTDVTESDTAGSGNDENDGIIHPVVASGGGTVYGRVVDGEGRPVPCFVGLLIPAASTTEPPRFVTGEGTDPRTGDFTMTAGDGSYFLDVDRNSLPPGLQAPPRVNLSIATTGEEAIVSYDAGAATVDDGGRTRVILRTRSAAGRIRGTVLDGGGGPLSALVAVLDASNGRPIREAFTDPRTGVYRVTLGDGAFNLRLEPQSLPPGMLPPQDVRVSVRGDTITEGNTVGIDPDGGSANGSDDAVVNFVVKSAGASLTGYVRDADGRGAFARVGLFAPDASGEYSIFVNGTAADPASGWFRIGIRAGTYRVDVDPGSIPPGSLAPRPVGISVATDGLGQTTITFPDDALTEDEGGVTRLILGLRRAAGGVAGAVMRNGAGVPCFVLAEDANTGAFVGGSPTDPDGNYRISLPAGTFRISIDAFSLPRGVTPPEPERVTVSDSVIAGVDFTLAEARASIEGYVLIPGSGIDTADPSIDCGAIEGDVGVTPVACSIVLLIPSNDAHTPPTFLGATNTDPATGFFSMPLRDGTFELNVDGATLPPGALPPPPLTLSVSGSTVNITGEVSSCTDDATRKILFVASGGATLDGVVQDASGAGVGAFVEVIDPTKGHFFTGAPTDPEDGSFRVTLGSRSYDVRVDPASVPPGMVPPPPVRVSRSTDGSVSVETVEGVRFDDEADRLIITLRSATLAVSGRVLDEEGNGRPAIVTAFDGAGNMRGQVWSDSATGNYNLPLAPGTYRIQLDPQSLPPGYAPPQPTTVNLLETSATGVDLALVRAAASLRGRVYMTSGGGDIGVPAFVEVVDASSGAFMTGMQAAPDADGDFAYSLNLGAGFFRVGLEPESLPPGVPAPEPVRIQVSGTTITQLVDGQAVESSVLDFGLAGSASQLSGTVTFDGNGFPGFVIAIDPKDGRIVYGVPADSGGRWTMSLADGSYLVTVDPPSLPPGVPPPAPVRIRVADATVTQIVRGVPVASSQIDFVLVRSGSEISGSVTFGGSGVPAFVIAVDTTTDRIVNGAPADGGGNWAMTLADGTYRIAVDPPSLPPGYLPPQVVPVTVSSGFVAESAGTENDGIIPFILSQAAASLSVGVADDGGGGLFAYILITNTGDGRIIAEGPVSPDADFVVALADGTYDVVVDPPSLPFDVVPPVPSRITVSGDAITLTGAGSGALSNGRLLITAQRGDQAAEVTVRVRDGDGNPFAAAVRVRDGAGNILFLLDVPADPDGFPLLLGGGDFYVGIDPGSVPPGSSLPSAAAVHVEGTTATPSSVTLILTDERVTLSGTVRNALDEAGAALVILDLYDGEGTRIRGGVPLAPVEGTRDATYAVDLAVGTYELALRRASGVTGRDVILPQNTPVAVRDGTIQNPDDDPDTEGVQVDITVPAVKGLISGQISLRGGALSGLAVIARDPVDNRTVNGATTDGDGRYTLALPAGVCQVLPDPDSLARVAPAALPPEPYEVNVSGSGDISVVDRDDLCVGSGPDESCSGLDFALEDFDADQDALITGTVRSRRSDASDPAAVGGARVLLIDPAKEAPRSSSVTAADGSYSLIAPDGVWFVVVDPAGLAIGYPTIPASPVRVGVGGMTVTEDDETGEGNEIDDGTVNFVLRGATAFVEGTVMTSDGIGVGARLVVSTADKTEMPEDFAYTIFTDPSGHFFLPVGEGNFKLWVAAESLPPGFLPPAATVFMVDGATVTESDTAGTGNGEDDGIINPVVTSGGGAVYGRVVDGGGNPVPCFIGLLIPAAGDNDPPRFVTGSPSDPDSGDFGMTAGDGSYFLEVDPNSLPPGLQAPPRVNLSVTTSDGAAVVSFGDSANTVDDGGITRVLLEARGAAGAIRGLVLDGEGLPVPAVVVVLDAADDRFVRDVFVDPASGAYGLSLGDGAYNLQVDPESLPPGMVPPQAVRVSITGESVAEGNATGVDPDDGVTENAADDGVVNFVVRAAAATLSGYVRDAGGYGAFSRVGLFSPDASGGYSIFVNGATSDPASGLFRIGISDGTYRVEVDPGSIPPGSMPPRPVVISVAINGGQAAITFPDDATTVQEGGVTRLILSLRRAAGGVSGAVTLDGAGVPVFVAAVDANTGQFVGGSPTDPDGNYWVSLPAGTFEISIDPFSLPQGVTPPSPQRVTVSDRVVGDTDFALARAGVTLRGYVLLPAAGVDADSLSVDCSDLAGQSDVTPVSCSVALLVPSGDATTSPTFLGATNTDPATGSFAMPLGEGTFQLQIDGGTLPPGTLPPPPLTLSVTGSTVNITGDVASCSNDGTRKIIFVSAGGATLRGYVKDGNRNGVGAFVEAIDPTEGHFFTGAPTDPQTGSFQLTLGDRSYDVRVSPDSVPPGWVPPPPVRVSTSDGGAIAVETVPGVSYEGGELTITLSSASLSVSGRVLDADGGGMPVIITAFDAADNLRGQVWSDASTGAYSLPLAPGNYEIRVDPKSLPPGYAPPQSVTVNLVDASATGVDFEVAEARASIRGKVYVSSGGVESGVPAFVEIAEASSGNFVTGAYAAPNADGDFVFSLNLGEGSFRVGLSPDSLPPGTIAPPPVGVTVSINRVTGNASIAEEAHASDTNLTDGVIDFELVGAGATLTGRLATPEGGGVSGFVFAERTGGGHVRVGEAQTRPDGSFSMAFTDGTYDLLVDPGSLPPGVIAPPPKRLTVVGETIQIEGSTISGTYELLVGVSTVDLTGHVYGGGSEPVSRAFVSLVDAESWNFVAGAETDEGGAYALPLVDGSFLVGLDSMSLPVGYTAPAPVAIAVRTAGGSTTITRDGSPITSLDFLLGQAVATVQVEAADAYGNDAFAMVEVRDASGATEISSAELRGGPAQLSLPAGSFLLVIPSFSLPPDLMAPPPVSLTVADDGTTRDGSGVPDDGIVRFVLQGAAVTISGSVIFDLATPEPIPGVEVLAIDVGSDMEIASTRTDAQGNFSLGLPVGEYEIEVLDGLPEDGVPPAPIAIRVSGSGQVDPSGDLAISVPLRKGVLSGTITLDGEPAQGEAIALVQVEGEWTEASFAEAGDGGAYELPLRDGTFAVMAELEAAEGIVIPPLPVTVIIPDGETPVEVTQDFAFFTAGAGGAPASQVLRGSVTAGGAPLDVAVVILYQGSPMGLVEPVQGQYQLALPADAERPFAVGLYPPNLPSGFTPPALVPITVGGAGITGEGVTEQEGSYVLDFEAGLRGAIVHGDVTDWNGTALSGVQVSSWDEESDRPGPATVTDASGAYSLTFSEGAFELEIGFGLPEGAVRPAFVDVEVTAAGDAYTLTIGGEESIDGTLDWTLQQGRAHLAGRLTANGEPLDGDIVIFDGGEEITCMWASGGTFDLYLPAGQLTIFPEVDSPPSGLIWPAPLRVTVPAEGEVVEISYDFDFTPVAAGTPGRSVSGRVFSNGLGYETDLELATSDGTMVGVLGTDASGLWQVTLAPGTYGVRVAEDDVPDGYAGPRSATILVAEDGVSGPLVVDGTLDLALNTQGVEIAGTVTGPDGQPVAGVMLLLDPESASLPALLATSDPNGGYRSLVTGQAFYEIDVLPASLPEGVVIPAIDGVDVTDRAIALDIALQAAAGTIAGSVLLDGQPVDAEVVVVPAGEAAIGDDGELDEVTFIEVEADGSYSLPMPAGTYTVLADLLDGGAGGVLYADPLRVTVAQGTVLEDVDFGFFAVGADHPGQALGGRILRGEQDLPGTVLILKEIGGNAEFYALVPTASVEGTNVYEILLSPGTYRVEPLSRDGALVEYFESIRIAVTADAVSRDGVPLPGNALDLQLLGEPSGQVLFDGAPVANAVVAAWPTGGGAGRTAVTDQDGSFAFETLRPGDYWVSVKADSLPGSGALPRLQPVYVTAGGASPSVLPIGIPPATGTLSGQVTVDGTGVPATVTLFDAALRAVAVVETDASGNYQVPLAAGTYAALAELADPNGDEVPPVPAGVTIAGDAARDFAFSTVTPAQTLTGTVAFGGDAANVPVLVVEGDNPPLPVARARTGSGGTDGGYATPLPYGDYEVLLFPMALPPGDLAPEAVPITVDAGGITSRNPDTQPVADNTLAIDPYGGDDPGAVRAVVADALGAILTRDIDALGALLHPDAVWSGLSRTEILAQWPESEAWNREGRRFDLLVSSLTQEDPDTWVVWVPSGREFWVASDGTPREEVWDATFTDAPTWKLTVARDGAGSPWRLIGNDLPFQALGIEHTAGLSGSGGGSQPFEEAEFWLDEWPGKVLSAVSVSGEGIVDGTLTRQEAWGEWSARTGGEEMGPAPFDASLAALATGGAYTFAVTDGAGGSGTYPILYRRPAAGLYPTAELSLLGTGDVLLLWSDIHARIPLPLACVELSVRRRTGGGEEEILEVSGLPAGRSWLRLAGSLFEDGSTYLFEVDYLDVAGGNRAFAFEVTWPPSGP